MENEMSAKLFHLCGQSSGFGNPTSESWWMVQT
jgi:hypothetical protein